MARSKKVILEQTTWMERFISALTIMCKAEPPLEYCQEWVDDVAVNGAYRLQNWVGAYSPSWAQNIVTIEAAEVWADTPVEGAMHAERPQSMRG